MAQGRPWFCYLGRLLNLFKVIFIFYKRGNGSSTFLLGLLKGIHSIMYGECAAQHLKPAEPSGDSLGDSKGARFANESPDLHSSKPTPLLPQSWAYTWSQSVLGCQLPSLRWTGDQRQDVNRSAREVPASGGHQGAPQPQRWPHPGRHTYSSSKEICSLA